MKARNLLMGLMVLASFSAQAAQAASNLTIEMQEDSEAYPGDEYLTRQGYVMAFNQSGNQAIATRMDDKEVVQETMRGEVTLRVDSRRLDCIDIVVIPPADLMKIRADGANHTLTLSKVEGSNSLKSCLSVKLDGKDIKLVKSSITSELNESGESEVFVLDLN